jgi:hypothetical protein
LKLGHHSEHPVHRPAFGGGGVDALLDDVQVDASLAENSAVVD